MSSHAAMQMSVVGGGIRGSSGDGMCGATGGDMRGSMGGSTGGDEKTKLRFTNTTGFRGVYKHGKKGRSSKSTDQNWS